MFDSLVKRIGNSLIPRAVAIYFLISWVIVESVGLASSYFGLLESTPFSVAKFLLFLAYPVIGAIVIIDGVPPSARRIFLIRMLWTLGPLAAFYIGFMAWIIFFSQSTVTMAFVLVAGFLVTFLWMQLNNPFARRWLFSRIEKSKSVIDAEKRLSWPFKLDEVEDTEIHVSPRLYYAMLAAIAAIAFIVLETLAGETLGDTFLTGGYDDAVIIALVVAAVMFPIHKHVSARLNISEAHATEGGASNFTALGSEAVRALRSFWRIFFIKYWYLTVPALLVLILFYALAEEWLREVLLH